MSAQILLLIFVLALVAPLIGRFSRELFALFRLLFHRQAITVEADVPANSLIIVELDGSERIHPVKNLWWGIWNASGSKRPGIGKHPLQASFQIDSLLKRISPKAFRTDVTLQKLR